MAPNIRHTGDNFVILRRRARSRAGVMRLSRRLVGDASSFPNFTLVYNSPGQFPGYLANRLLLSARLARLAHIHLFLFRPLQRLSVGGAFAQYGSGTAGPIERDSQGRVVYAGFDAAHVRLGTYYLDDQSVWRVWQRRLEGLILTAGGGHTIPELLPVNGTMVNLMSMYDAVTDRTDALFNRAFGLLESGLHPAMNNMLMHEVPQDLEAFGTALVSFNENFPRFLTVLLRRRAEERLREIRQDPSREQMQSADGPRMFAGETDLLQALVDQAHSGSATWREVQHSQRLSRNDIQEEMNDVRLAQEELAEWSGA